MIEIPESINLSNQMNDILEGKVIQNVYAAKSPHKFAWYYKDAPEKYHELLTGLTIGEAYVCGGRVEIDCGKAYIYLGEGLNIRYHEQGEKINAKNQLQIEFGDFSCITCTVQMYGLIWAFPKNESQSDDFYYTAAKERPNPLYPAFDREYFENLYKGASPKLSAKAFLATEQRIPGFGNGVLQDILFYAGIHPKKKIGELNDSQIDKLFETIKSKLLEMMLKGGRDVQKDLFGCPGRYKTVLSSATFNKPCPVCGSQIIRQAYLGGNIYFCSVCQKE